MRYFSILITWLRGTSHEVVGVEVRNPRNVVPVQVAVPAASATYLMVEGCHRPLLCAGPGRQHRSVALPCTRRGGYVGYRLRRQSPHREVLSAGSADNCHVRTCWSLNHGWVTLARRAEAGACARDGRSVKVAGGWRPRRARRIEHLLAIELSVRSLLGCRRSPRASSRVASKGKPADNGTYGRRNRPPHNRPHAERLYQSLSDQ
jgi:hypothetical protein